MSWCRSAARSIARWRSVLRNSRGERLSEHEAAAHRSASSSAGEQESVLRAVGIRHSRARNTDPRIKPRDDDGRQSIRTDHERADGDDAAIAVLLGAIAERIVDGILLGSRLEREAGASG